MARRIGVLEDVRGQAATALSLRLGTAGPEASGPYTAGNMIVLGITETHCATVAVLMDGRVIGCASEERWSRLKNDAGYPRRAIDGLLQELGIAPGQIDLVALAGAGAPSREWQNRVLHDEAYAREYYGVSWPSRRRALERTLRKWGARYGLVRASRGKFGLSERERLDAVTEHLGVAPERIVCLDHHSCHAAAAYWGSGFEGREALVLTNDNSGDGLCATASTGRGLALERHEGSPSAPGSLGSFYSWATLALGMKFGEDEHKVMGLAPYAPDRYAARAEAALRAALRSGRRAAGALPVAHAGGALPGLPASPGGAALRRRRGRRAAPPRGRPPAVEPADAPALRRRTPRPGRRCLHERQGQHADRPGGLGGRALRLPVLRRRVERGGRRVPRLRAGVRAPGRAGRPAALRARLPRVLGDGRGGGGRGPRAAARGPVRGGLPRAHRGAHRGAADLGRGGGPLRGTDGVRGPRAGQPVDPGQPIRPSRGGADQPDDQEPRLLDALRPDGARGAGAATTWSIRRASPRPT